MWKVDYVVKNKYSRPAIKLHGVEGIVMHWTADEGATDENEAEFFDGSDGGGSRYASAHLFIDRDSATLIIPLDEVAYHANDHKCKVAKLGSNANLCTIGVEMCVEKDGTIHKDTVNRAVEEVAYLCKRFKLDPTKDIYRHYDVTGKNCPAPWVKDGKKFTAFKTNVKKSLVDEFKELLKVGSTGLNVKKVQSFLGITSDGIFGKVTEAKVKEYQKKQGLTVDGVVGKNTWNKMFN